MRKPGFASGRNWLGAGQLWPLLTTPTNQLPKPQAGGEVVCKREKEELLSRPTSRAGGAPASQFTRGGPWLLSPGKQVTETQACGPMESQVRGNVLRHVPNGKQFCFPFVSQALDQPLTGNTSAGARASCGFQAAFAETGTGILLLTAPGSRCTHSGSVGVCLKGIR